VARARLAPALRLLRAEVDVAWPERSRLSDGWIGDAAHQGRHSDHNPDPDGIVHALDITAKGINVRRLVVDCTHHPSCWYVISGGWLYSRTHRFVGVPYDGPDPHTSHVHVNIRHDPTSEQSKRSWLTADA